MNFDRITDRWLATLGIGTLLFGIGLFVLRIPVRTIMIFFALGIPVVLLWLYVGQKSRRRQDEMDAFNKLQDQVCICPVCEHASDAYSREAVLRVEYDTRDFDKALMRILTRKEI